MTWDLYRLKGLSRICACLIYVGRPSKGTFNMRFSCMCFPILLSFLSRFNISFAYLSHCLTKVVWGGGWFLDYFVMGK